MAVDSHLALDTFAAHAAALVFVKDRGRRYTAFSLARVPALGLRREDFLGRRDDEVLPSALARRLADLDARVLATGASRAIEVDVEGRRGPRTFHVLAFPIRADDGAVVAVGGIASDVTRRARAERRRNALAHAGKLLSGSLDERASLRAIASIAGERLGDAAWLGVLDDGGALRCLEVAARDPAHRALVEELRAPSSGLPSPTVRDVIANMEPVLVRHVDDAFAARLTSTPAARRIVEQVAPRSLVFAPLVGRRGPIGLLAVASTRRALDHDDEAAVVELARCASLSLDAARMYGASQDAVHERERAVSIAAHELRTPLAALSLLLEKLLRDARRGHDPARCLAGLDAAVAQLTRTTELVELLFDLARITTGNLALAREDGDVCDVVKETLKELEADALAAGCALATDGDPRCPARFDRLRMAQVLRNLVGNALKHAPGARVVVRTRVEVGRVRVEVQDDGPGIDAQKLKTIFEPFVRGEHDGGAGLGLGLYVARGIVEAHGGGIAVTSEAGAGATFSFTLPTR